MEVEKEFEEIEKPFEHLPGVNGLNEREPEFDFGMDKAKAVEEEIEEGCQLPKIHKSHGRPQVTMRVNAHVADALDMYVVDCGSYNPDQPVKHKVNPRHGYSYTAIIEAVLSDIKKYGALKKALENE